MNITVSTKAIQEAIKALKPIVPASSTQPVLKNFLFHSEDDVLNIKASCMEVTMTVNLNIRSDDQSEREFLIDANFFSKLVSSIKDKEITIEFDEDFRSCAIHTKKGVLDFVIEDPSFYPEISMSEFDGKPFVTVDTNKFLTAIKMSQSYQYNGNERPQMQGTFFKVENNKISVYATNMNRMLRYAIPLECPNVDMKVLIPQSATKLISALAGEDVVSIHENGNRVMMSNNTTAFIFQKMEFSYPNCDAVIPSPAETQLITDREDIIDSLKQIQVLALDETVVLFSNENMNPTFELSDYTMGRNADVKIDMSLMKLNSIPSSFKIGFNANGFLTILSSMDSKMVAIHMSEPNKPIIVRSVDEKTGKENDNIDMLIMPMRIN